jgi:pilus assembly protein CpaB
VAQNRGGPFLILAVVLGLAASAVVFFYLNQQSAANVTARQTRPVVVAASDVTFGTKLDRNLLKVVNYPKDSVPPGAYSSLDSVVGQTTKIFLATKEPVLMSKLSTIGGGLSMMVRPNMRASSVTVNLVSSVSGFVVPGVRVDVLVTIDRMGGGMQNATTRTILQNIEVLAAGVKTESKDQQNKPNTDLQTVTLLVDPPSAERMALAMHEGKIHLTLRNPEDADTLKLASVSTGEMLGSGNAPVSSAPRGPRTAARSTAPRVEYRDRVVQAPVKEEPYKVTVIKTGKQAEQEPANEKTGNK